MSKKFYTKAETAGLPESELQPPERGFSISPIEPTICKNTGRLLTEWYEHPVLTEEDIKHLAAVTAGFEDGVPSKFFSDMTSEEKDKFKIYRGVINSKKSTKFKGGMSRQEVAHRMNEASKMIDPDNHKVLDKATQERTGLELNPLYGIELQIRSGTLSPKDMLTALKTLAEYTHSKAPTVATVNNTHSWEAHVFDLAKEAGYEVIDVEENVRSEYGMGINYISTMENKVKLLEEAEVITENAYEDIANQLDGFELRDFDSDGEDE